MDIDNIKKKKKVIIYGNCHTESLYEILSKVHEFTNEYNLCPIEPIYKIKDKNYFSNPIFKECDIFIHQSIRINNRYGEEFASENVIRLLKKDCKIIAIPNVYHMPMCFFPQYSSEKEFKTKNNNTTIFFRDKIIDESFIKGLSVKEILNNYDKNDLFEKEDLKKQFAIFIEKVKKREEEWDIKASEFIEKHYKEQRLFYDPNHPTPFFIKYIAGECLKKLDIVYEKSAIDNMKISCLDSYEMPICKCVKNLFGMNYKDELIRETGIKIRNKEMDTTEYIKQYICFEWQNEDIYHCLIIKSYIRYMEMIIENFIEKSIRFVKRKVKVRKHENSSINTN